MITDVSGASKVFSLGVATYQNSQKTEILGVDEKTISKKGAVSLEVAASMAQGILYKSDADCTLSITGLAGPDGDGSDTQPGTAFIGLADKDTTYVVKIVCSTRMGREYVRNCFALASLNLLRLYLEGYDLEKVEYLQELVSMETPEKPEEIVPEPEVRVETEVVEKIVYVDKEPEIVEKIVEKIVYVEREPKVDIKPSVLNDRPVLDSKPEKKIADPEIIEQDSETPEDIGSLLPKDDSDLLPEVDKKSLAESLDSLF